MPDFHFSHPIEVRYGDLDPQGHVNNASFLTYFEQARIHYLGELGMIKKRSSSFEVGIILADAHVTFLAPVLFGMVLSVKVSVTRLGNKSMTMEYLMLENATGRELARGSTVLVTFDYQKQESMPVPVEWREKISAFENLSG
ncbi:MAG TPA: thioesterase family protein [Anaerolineales bacterium]|jgi:acyl-CoA thioester hydrolase